MITILASILTASIIWAIMFLLIIRRATDEAERRLQDAEVFAGLSGDRT